MRNDGSTISADARIRRVAICLTVALALLAAACATDSEAPEPPVQSQAQLDLDANTSALGTPLVTETQQEGTLLGGLLGGAVGFGFGSRRSNDNVSIAMPVGMLAGSMAGRYVAAKQAEYSEKVAVIEAITRDVKQKNVEAGRTIKAMETVVAEHRARLAQLRAAKDTSRKTTAQLEQQVAVAKQDLDTMKQAVGNAEGQLALFGEARGLVVTSKEPDAAESSKVKVMDIEVESLRNRIRSMQKLVGDLSSVS
jgi:uncharacterized protein YhaN